MLDNIFFFKTDNSEHQNGQILLVVVITMIVALTVGLSIASRIVTNIRISQQNEESQRAFSAAEAGVEQALEAASGTAVLSNEFSNNSQFSTTITEAQGSSIVLNAGDNVAQDAGIDVWLSNYPDYANQLSGEVTLYWGDESQNSCTKTAANAVFPAIEVLILSGSVSNPSVTKQIYDSCSRIAGSTSPSSGAAIGEINFQHSASISFTNGLLMRVIPVFNSSKVAVTSDIALPAQGQLIESTGKSGDTVRKIQYYTSYPQVPLEIFPYSIISQ